MRKAPAPRWEGIQRRHRPVRARREQALLDVHASLNPLISLYGSHRHLLSCRLLAFVSRRRRARATVPVRLIAIAFKAINSSFRGDVKSPAISAETRVASAREAAQQSRHAQPVCVLDTILESVRTGDFQRDEAVYECRHHACGSERAFLADELGHAFEHGLGRLSPHPT